MPRSASRIASPSPEDTAAESHLRAYAYCWAAHQLAPYADVALRAYGAYGPGLLDHRPLARGWGLDWAVRAPLILVVARWPHTKRGRRHDAFSKTEGQSIAKYILTQRART